MAEQDMNVELLACEGWVDRLLISRSRKIISRYCLVTWRILFFPYYFVADRARARLSYLRQKTFHLIFEPENAAWLAYADAHGRSEAHAKFGCQKGGCYCNYIKSDSSSTRSQEC